MNLPSRLAAMLLLAHGAGQAQQNCEALRAQVDGKVRASGVTAFSLQIVAADAKVAGKVVGTCELGSRKIVYQASAAAAPAPAGERILTECRDGSVTYGDCKR